MSIHKAVIMEIEDAITTGDWSFREIAEHFGVSLEFVLEISDTLERQYNDSMDGDHETALASAGWGTDEDYGYYGEDY